MEIRISARKQAGLDENTRILIGKAKCFEFRQFGFLKGEGGKGTPLVLGYFSKTPKMPMECFLGYETWDNPSHGHEGLDPKRLRDALGGEEEAPRTPGT